MAAGDPDWKDYRRESRKNYGQEGKEGAGICLDQLNSGSLMRIADAMEKIADHSQTHTGLFSSIRWSINEMNRRPTQEKREITRLKNIVKKQKAEIAQLKGA